MIDILLVTGLIFIIALFTLIPFEVFRLFVIVKIRDWGTIKYLLLWKVLEIVLLSVSVGSVVGIVNS